MTLKDAELLLHTGFTMNTGYAVFGSLLAPLGIVASANAFDWHIAFYLTIIPGVTLSFVILKICEKSTKARTSKY
ncbi:hypothetical protein RCO48_19585 [Peribacillus frigoritolerans]|nr:hypothetical protein [Peribacillus frigoritolerans]